MKNIFSVFDFSGRMQRREKHYSRLVLLAMLSWMPVAWAAPVVSSQLQVHAVVVEQGHEVLKDVAAAKPGDLLDYRAVYNNAGDAPASHLMANLPIPAGTSLQADDIKPAGALASVDGVTFAPMPLMTTVVGKDGKPHQQPVPLADIRAMRWDLGELDAHKGTEVEIRVRVNVPDAVATSAAPAVTAAVGGH